MAMSNPLGDAYRSARRLLFGGADADVIEPLPPERSAQTPAHPPAQAAATDAGGSGPGGVEPADLLHHAVLRLRGGRIQHAGSLQLLGLSAIRERLGDRWVGAAAKVHRIVGSVLKHRLQPGDVYSQAAADTYLILFAELGRDQAEFKAQVIAEEITRLICGEVPEGDNILVKSVIAELDGRVSLQDVKSVQDLAELIRQTAKTEGKRRAVAQQLDLSTEDRDLLLQGKLAAPLKIEHRTVEQFLAECAPRFCPVWNVRQKVISGYRTSIVHNKSGRPASAADDPYLSVTNELGFALDCVALRASAVSMDRLLKAGRKVVIVFPIHFETLADSRHRHAYVKLAGEVPRGFQPLLSGHIIEVPVGTPQTRLLEIVSMLKHFCRSVTLHVPLDYRLVGTAANIGCFAVSTEVTAAAEQMRRTVSELCAFAQRATVGKLAATLSGADTIGLASAAVSAGFSYISGDVIGGYADEPGDMRPFDLE
mgnify:FL=1